MDISGLPGEDPLSFEALFGVSIDEQSVDPPAPLLSYPPSDPDPRNASGVELESTPGGGGQDVTGPNLELLPVQVKGANPVVPGPDKSHEDRYVQLLNDKLHHMRMDKHQCEAELKDLQTKHSKLEKSLSQEQTDKAYLRQQLAEKERILERSTRNQQAIAEDLSERIHQLEEEKQVLQREIADLYERLARSEWECRRLMEELRAVREEMRPLTEKYVWEYNVAKSATHYVTDMLIDIYKWFIIRVLLLILAYVTCARFISV